MLKIKIQLPKLKCTINKFSFIIVLILSQNLQAKTSELKHCLIKNLKTSDQNVSVESIIKKCEKTNKSVEASPKRKITPLENRIKQERATQNSPNVITPHMLNYMLPLTYTSHPNQQLAENLSNNPEGQIDKFEAKFQLSFKAPVFENIFKKNDGLYFAFTMQSFWQMYKSSLSSPFRETNYQPEVFYFIENDWQSGPWKNPIIMFGIEHQSNGRAQQLSRSWNRIYANFIFEKDNLVISFKPWYRLPEHKKLNPLQAKGDDNPDIGKFMGNFEFRSVYHWKNQNFSLMIRNNLKSNNKGAIELGWTFPMGKRFKGYTQIFSGYGESLIDYNHKINRIGIGILLTDFL